MGMLLPPFPMRVQACEECTDSDFIAIVEDPFVINRLMDNEISLEATALREYIQQLHPDRTILNINYIDTAMNPWVIELFHASEGWME